jgi:imidazolonepropionase-like amidohydrolase
MATTDAADAIGLGDDTGRLAGGYRADLLLVDGDPLNDLEALRDVRAVMAGGRLVTG